MGIFPDGAAVMRLMGAILLARIDHWRLNRRYMQPKQNPQVHRAGHTPVGTSRNEEAPADGA